MGKKPFAILLGLCTASMLLAGCEAASSTNGVYGTILDANNAPVAMAVIEAAPAICQESLEVVA